MSLIYELIASPAGASLLVLMLAWLSHHLILTRLKATVQHEFNAQLEQLRAELLAKQSQIDSLRDGALAGAAHRRDILATRQLAAVEQLWKAFNALGPARMALKWLSVVKFEQSLKLAATDQRVRDMFTALGKVDTAAMNVDEAWQSQPFVSPRAWELFSTYRAVVSAAAIRLLQLQHGVEVQAINDKAIADMVKTALPGQATYIDEHGFDGLELLLPELEGYLLAELRRMLLDRQGTFEEVAKSVELIRNVEELAVQVGKNTDGITTSGISAEVPSEASGA